MSNKAKPILVRKGSVTVKLYTVVNRSGGKDYRQFVVAYRDGEGVRRLRKFSDGEEARMEAELAAAKLASGEGDVLSLTSLERSQYLRAKQMLDAIGTPLLTAVEDYVAARKGLPAGATLFGAVEALRNRQQVVDPSLMVAEAVRRYLGSKRAADWSRTHRSGVTCRLERVGEAFQMPLVNLTVDAVTAYLDGLRNERRGGAELSRRSLRNNIKILWAFFRHAVRQRWLHRDWLEQLAAIEMPESEHGPIEVFAGEEMQRLDWGHVDFDQGYIEVTARNAKVRGRRRLVPMSENLKAILLPLAKEHGPVLPNAGKTHFMRSRVA